MRTAPSCVPRTNTRKPEGGPTVWARTMHGPTPMTTTTHPAVHPSPSLVVGETVHYRFGGRCWAAAIVERGPQEAVQLFLFPLPPSFPMPQGPGTFIHHDGGPRDETWHRLDECVDGTPPRKGRARRRSPRKS